MMRPEIPMIVVLIASILLAAALEVYRPVPEPVPAAPAPVDYGASLWADCNQLDLPRASDEEVKRPGAGAAR
ncbi:MAG: hypothetical protein CMH94_04360 [Oceanicaulis sp.]|jgi:hypothetical protein|nr:hypothetical protein [Oceanicaulis sp.]MBI74815.1 hypothetical protein [Oceanicaulis sp.]